MSAIIAPIRVERTTVPLEQLLAKLQTYGLPRLTMPNAEGWYCVVEMNTNTTGTDFKVQSEFKHANPAVAAQQCLERILGALTKLDVKP